MDIHKQEKIYHKLENYSLKYINDAKDRGFEQDTSKAVGMAVGKFIVEMHDEFGLNDKEIKAMIIDFVQFLDSNNGSSIKKGLGKLAEVDYEILKHCKKMTESFKKDEIDMIK